MAILSKRGFSQNGKSYYTNVTTPQDVNLQFTVTPTNGLGVTSVKSNGYVRNVFMNTSVTPTANNGYTNPDPAAGYALIQFYNPFNYYLNGFTQFIAPSTGSIKIDNSALTAGTMYVISTLGDASLATWQAIGVPQGITPAVGVSFVALTVGAGANTSTSRVSTPTTSGIVSAELVGLPSTMISPSNIAVNGGAWLAVKFNGSIVTMTAYTPAGTNSAPTFTGSALAAHSHDFLVKGGQAASTTNNIAAYAGPLIGKEAATDATFAGGSATNGGVQALTAGTPAGTVSAPTFTGTEATLVGTVTLAAAAPATGSIICMKFSYDASSDTIDGL